MINAAALWPLLEPQWKDPKKWWKELATAKGRKDYDWAHLAMRYGRRVVDEKCRTDPSLGVAHGSFWRTTPSGPGLGSCGCRRRIGEDFCIEEAPYRPGGHDDRDEGDRAHREAWLRDHPREALAAVEMEAVRRMGRGKARRVVSDMRILESGLWTALPDQVWAMELRIAEKQALISDCLLRTSPPRAPPGWPTTLASLRSAQTCSRISTRRRTWRTMTRTWMPMKSQ
jgi:hypothetical protein